MPKQLVQTARFSLAVAADPGLLAMIAVAVVGLGFLVAEGAVLSTQRVHGIGYALGATFGVAHGHTSCVMLPAVLKWNAAVNAERQRALSAAMGASGRPAWELVKELIAGLDQPVTLRAVGIRRENFDEIARRALEYHPVKANPRPVRTADDVKEILELAW